MRYIVYGAGAIGGVIGGSLAERQRHVVLIARGQQLAALRKSGLQLQTPDGMLTLPVRTAAHPSDIRFREDDVVVLAMKTQHTAGAVQELRAAAGDGVAVVCAQNGVENERIASRHFQRVYAMMVNVPATYLEPGVVQAHAAPVRGFMDLGRYPNGSDPICESIADDLNRATFRVQVESQVMRWKYAKLLTNLANALQAACGPDADVSELDAKLRAEGVACFRAAGIEWASANEMRERHGGLEFRPIDGKDREGGSSWQSLARGAGSIEADYLNGEIALLGRLHGVPTPLNAALQELVGKMARQRRQPGTMTVTEMREALGMN